MAVFQPINGLPPAREQDHQLRLREGTVPPNIRPYRYPYYQKAEIEAIVKDLLTSGIIKKSTSPYASPVLLVKKKMEDGGCVWIIGL